MFTLCLTQLVLDQFVILFGCFKGCLNLTCHFLCVCSDILNELLQRENRVLHFWTMRKRRLDQCQQYVVFERSANQVRGTRAPTRLKEKGDVLLYEQDK